MKRARLIQGVAALVGVACAGQASGAVISYTDLWDVSQGTTILGTSGTKFNSTRDMFGANDSTFTPERGTTLFTDAYYAQPGFRHWVEWQTPSNVTVGEFALWASGDGNGIKRAFNRFSLEAWEDGTGYVTVFDSSNSIPYPWVDGVEGLVYEQTLTTAVTARRWRASFYQASGDMWAAGPRVFELDAAAPVPEPFTIALGILGLGAAGFKRLRRK